MITGTLREISDLSAQRRQRSLPDSRLAGIQPQRPQGGTLGRFWLNITAVSA